MHRRGTFYLGCRKRTIFSIEQHHPLCLPAQRFIRVDVDAGRAAPETVLKEQQQQKVGGEGGHGANQVMRQSQRSFHRVSKEKSHCQNLFSSCLFIKNNNIKRWCKCISEMIIRPAMNKEKT